MNFRYYVDPKTGAPHETEKTIKPSGFPKGWDERRVSKLLAHCETQSEEESVVEDDAIWLDPEPDRDGGSVQARTGGARVHRQT